jgi:hypothetical protein
MNVKENMLQRKLMLAIDFSRKHESVARQYFDDGTQRPIVSSHKTAIKALLATISSNLSSTVMLNLTIYVLMN